MTKNHVLDLFCGLGGFSAAFAESGRWSVMTVDIEGRFDPDITADVFDLRPSDFDTEFDVVLAGHPCTYFTTIRRTTKGGDDAWDGHDPQTDPARDHVAMVYHTEGLIRGLDPDYWFFENPRGTLRNIWKQPECTVWYCQYGHETAKPTDLWGHHPPTFSPKTCNYGNDDCGHVRTKSYKEHGGGSDNRQGILTETDSAERATIPYDLSASIRTPAKRHSTATRSNRRPSNRSKAPLRFCPPTPNRQVCQSTFAASRPCCQSPVARCRPTRSGSYRK